MATPVIKVGSDVCILLPSYMIGYSETKSYALEINFIFWLVLQLYFWLGLFAVGLTSQN